MTLPTPDRECSCGHSARCANPTRPCEEHVPECPLQYRDGEHYGIVAQMFVDLTDELIDGDFFGPTRGRYNCATNVLHYLKALDRAVDRTLDPDQRKALRAKANEIRDKTWPAGGLRW